MQVGPALLVLGKEAQKYGLSVSLFERLKHRYESIGGVALPHLKKLNVNYRCHKFLMRFLSDLFYNSSLQCCSSVREHHKAHFPLVFCCSDINEHANPGPEPDFRPEIQALLGELKRFFVPWPAHWGQPQRAVCVISSTRPQVGWSKGDYIQNAQFVTAVVFQVTCTNLATDVNNISRQITYLSITNSL